jgi:hypothetical protein
VVELFPYISISISLTDHPPYGLPYPPPPPLLPPQVMQQWWELFADAAWQAYSAGAAALRGFLGLSSSPSLPPHPKGDARAPPQPEDPDEPLEAERISATPGRAWPLRFRQGGRRPAVLPVVTSPRAREDETLGEVCDDSRSRRG